MGKAKRIKELNDKLKQECPRLWKSGQPHFSCVGEGWWDIIYRLCVKLEPLVSDNASPTIGQIKEKFGTLRFYLFFSETDKMSVLIREAEDESAKTCEECGAPGKQREINHWVKTSCERCHKKRLIGNVSSRLELLVKFGFSCEEEEWNTLIKEIADERNSSSESE
jgi:hypothetical protein